MIFTTDPDTAHRLNITLAVPIAYRVTSVYGEVLYGDDKQDLIREIGEANLLYITPLYAIVTDND